MKWFDFAVLENVCDSKAHETKNIDGNGPFTNMELLIHPLTSSV